MKRVPFGNTGDDMTRTLTLVAVLAATTVLAQMPDFSKVEIKATPVAGSISMLEGAGGNIGVSVGEDGVFVIDDQFPPLAPKIKAAIAKLSKQPVRFVFNTHWHMDHVGGNEAMGKDGAVIVAHENVRKRLSTDQVMALFGGMKIPASPPKALPVMTFTQDVAFWLNGDELRVTHLPAAHTDGDAAVRFVKANIIHCGDLFVNGAYPVIDVGSGGSVEGLIAAQQKLMAMADDKTKIIPGHGPLGDKASLKAANDLLINLRDRIAKLVKEGKTMDQIKAAKPTADLDAKYSNGFVKGDMITEMVAASLGAKK
jgi:cyclase